MLIVYAIICLTYIQFYKSIDDAAKGNNQAVNQAPGIEPHSYNRKNKASYPYKSRAQWLKAVYGFVGCSLLALFSGWQSFVTPFSGADFVAAHISIAIFLLIVTAYHIMLDGWNPRYWKRTNSPEARLTSPRPQTVTRDYRAGHLRLTEKNVSAAPSASGTELEIHTGQQEIAEPVSVPRAIVSWIWEWVK